MIKNRNIASDAKIDRSKLNLVDGMRFFENDFDDASIAVTNLYGFGLTVANSPTAVTGNGTTEALSGIALITCDGSAASEAIVYNTTVWSAARKCKMGVRLTSASAIDAPGTIEISIGFSLAPAVIGNWENDFVALRLDYGNSAYPAGQWVLAYNVGSGTQTFVNTGVVEDSTETDLAAGWPRTCEVQMLPGGAVQAFINGRSVFRGKLALADLTEVAESALWYPMISVQNSASTADTVSVDSFYCQQLRKDA